MNCNLRVFLVGIGLVWSMALSSQVRPVFTLGNRLLIINDQFVGFHGGVGIKHNDHFSNHFSYVLLNTGIQFRSENGLTPMRSSILSYSLGYRIFKEVKKVSPHISIDFGIPFYSNADSSFVNASFMFSNEYEPGMHFYNRGLLFGKLKLLCDIKLNSFNLFFGVSQNLMISEVLWLYPTSTVYQANTGYKYFKLSEQFIGFSSIGLETGVSYTISSKRTN